MGIGIRMLVRCIVWGGIRGVMGLLTVGIQTKIRKKIEIGKRKEIARVEWVLTTISSSEITSIA